MILRRIPLLLLASTSALVACSALFVSLITPKPFDEHTPPPAPDYAELATWASHPAKADPADLVPPGFGGIDPQADDRVDVFFIHPTTYYKKEYFNAPYNNPDAAKITNGSVMTMQAGSFNGAGQVYAPYYRQMALGGYFVDDKSDKRKGLALAYTDVERAFDYWLAHWNDGRPFILAGHSQGTDHAKTLLANRFVGPQGRALRQRLVAAYLIGGWVPENQLNSAVPLPPCETPHDTACVIGWRTLGEDAAEPTSPLADSQANLCVNPLTWSRSGAPAPASANLGALPLSQNAGRTLPRPSPGKVGARCAGGWLRIAPSPQGADWDKLAFKGDFHVYDYSLFYANIRENSQERATAWLENHAD